jgi:hypothetical protein
MVEDIVREARAVDPALKVNLHAVPDPTILGGAIPGRGSDFPHFPRFGDTSPMCYAHMLERAPLIHWWR